MGRKEDHLRIVLDGKAKALGSTGLEHFRLDHHPLTEIDFDSIELNCHFLGIQFSLPFMISSMTGGGGESTLRTNLRLAQFAKNYGIGLGLGSMRALLSNDVPKETVQTFSEVRTQFPDLFLAANLGAQQLVGAERSRVESLVKTIGVQALIIHLNPLQEMIQPEGDRNFQGIQNALDYLQDFSVPVILKETGCGFGIRSLKVIRDRYPNFILDIAGFGGTHWGIVEQYRNDSDHDLYEMGKRFANWGVPTAISLIHARKILDSSQQVIASGGLTTGTDIVKCLCLGANFTAMAGPVLKAVHEQQEDQWMRKLIHEMKICLFLLGVNTVKQLSSELISPLSPLQYDA